MLAQFWMSITVKGQVPQRKLDEPQEDEESLPTLLDTICEALEESGLVQFQVVGFSPEPWPVDVRTDLSVVIEQVPKAIGHLERGTAAEIGFYEQGIERIIYIDPNGDNVEFVCKEMLSGRSIGTAVAMERQLAVGMLKKLVDQFKRIVEQAYPEVASRSIFREWMNDYCEARAT